MREGDERIVLESAAAANCRVLDAGGTELQSKAAGNRIEVAVDAAAGLSHMVIENRGSRPAWFRLIERPVEHCWVAANGEQTVRLTPGRELTDAALPAEVSYDPDATFVAGRFGQALQLVPGRRLAIPDHVEINGQTVPLYDLRQGTIEFWVKRLSDDRIAPARPITFVTNGQVQAWSPWKLPLGEWAHVAVEWRPLVRDPERQAVHVYVNGLDLANYRSTWWQGYSQKPLTFPKAKRPTGEFVLEVPAGAAIAVDELRISSIPRYTDTTVEFGGHQTFNPTHFAPPQASPPADEQTLLLLRLDGDAGGETSVRQQPVEGQLTKEP